MFEEKNFNEVAAKDGIFGGKAYRKGEIIRTVRIRESEAELLNIDSPYTGVEYVVSENTQETDNLENTKQVLTDEEKEARKKLFVRAKELNLSVAKNISTDELIAKITEAENA